MLLNCLSCPKWKHLVGLNLEAHAKNLKFHRKHFLVKDSRDKFLTRVISWSLMPWGTVCVAVIASCPCNVHPFFLPNRTSVLSKIQCACVLSHFSPVWFFMTLWTVAHLAPLSMGSSRQEYWSGLPYPSPRDLPDPGIKPESPKASVLQADSLLLSHRGSPHDTMCPPNLHFSAFPEAKSNYLIQSESIMCKQKSAGNFWESVISW